MSAVCCLLSCNEDELAVSTEQAYDYIIPLFTHNPSLEDGGNANARVNNKGKRTVLGEKRDNPYTLEAMQAAHDFLHGGTRQLTATHYYVKFIPSSQEHLWALGDSDEVFYDFPLEYELIELGEYYQEVVEGEFPIYYAIVEAGGIYPSCPYEIISPLYIDRDDPLLTSQSFMLTGQGDDIYDDVPHASGVPQEAIGNIDGLPHLPPNVGPPPPCPSGFEPFLTIDNSAGRPI